MCNRDVVLRVAVVGVLAVFAAGIGLAQDAQHADRGQRRRWDPAQMRARMLERVKETLQCSDEEWTVLQPRLEKVMTLSREASAGGGRRMLFGRRSSGGGDAQPREPQNAVEKTAQDLQQTLDNKEATADQIKAKLTALREAREKVKQDLAKAKAELRELVTQRQEAMLVLMGTLD